MQTLSPANHFHYRTEFGEITIEATDAAICQVVLGHRELESPHAPSLVTNQCATQLMEYFAGRRTSFDVPMTLQGTDFQIAVWNAVCAIPYAQTRTATEIAEYINHQNAARMVGQALAANRLAILVPAHRVTHTRPVHTPSDRRARLYQACRALEQRHRLA